MVLVHIACPNREQAEEIIHLLLEKRLIADAMLSSKTVFDLEQRTGQDRILIIAKTKALLFNSLNEEIGQRYPTNTPSMYCIPIVYMDTSQSQYVLDNTLRV